MKSFVIVLQACITSHCGAAPTRQRRPEADRNQSVFCYPTGTGITSLVQTTVAISAAKLARINGVYPEKLISIHS